MKSNDAIWLIKRMQEEFPGLWDWETEVNGGDLVEWLSMQIRELEK